MIVRLIVIAIASVLLSAEIVRDAIVKSFVTQEPDRVAQIWSGHPAVEIALGMAKIAKAGRSHSAVPATAFALMNNAALKAPLAPEPFLVRGVEAELSGDTSNARDSFEAAQWRDPRSLPAAYFLAELDLRTGKIVSGLSEIAAVARLSPGGNLAVAPYIAAYAKNPENWPALRSMFQANPGIAEPALTALAANPDMAPAVIALAGPGKKAEDAPWFTPLLTSLTAAGRYEQAYSIWEGATGVKSPELIHDTSFSDRKSPPPFNWSLTSSSVGVAERQGGRLHILFYGQEDGILASQLLLLKPGQYHFSMQLTGDPARAHALTWSIWCDKADAPIASANLDVAANRGWNFAIHKDCPAQWLRLSGTSADIPQTVDVMAAALKLQKTNSSG